MSKLYRNFLPLFVCAACLMALLCQPHSARADEAASEAAAEQSAEDVYTQVDVDINGYENYTFGHPVSEYLTADQLTQFRAAESDDTLSFYDIPMIVDETKVEYTISLGGTGAESSIGSIEMIMDVKFGDDTFGTIKKQLEDLIGHELVPTPDATVEGGMHVSLQDSDGDTLDLSWTPANDKDVTPGTSVFVASSEYMTKLIDAIISQTETEAAPADGGDHSAEKSHF